MSVVHNRSWTQGNKSSPWTDVERNFIQIIHELQKKTRTAPDKSKWYAKDVSYINRQSSSCLIEAYYSGEDQDKTECFQISLILINLSAIVALYLTIVTLFSEFEGASCLIFYLECELNLLPLIMLNLNFKRYTIFSMLDFSGNDADFGILLRFSSSFGLPMIKRCTTLSCFIKLLPSSCVIIAVNQYQVKRRSRRELTTDVKRLRKQLRTAIPRMVKIQRLLRYRELSNNYCLLSKAAQGSSR